MGQIGRLFRRLCSADHTDYAQRAAIILQRNPHPKSIPFCPHHLLVGAVTTPRFFVQHPLPRPCASGTIFAVGESVARHLHVLRIASGESITLFDGIGGEFLATVRSIGKRDATVTLDIFNSVERESPLHITLVQALATADKMDLIVQKAVELGVTSIAPIASSRATLKLTGERAEKRIAHWQAIAVAACEQCGRNRVPLVREVQTLDQWLKNSFEGVRVLLHPDAEASLLASVDASRPIALLIGPEGGFTDDEIARAVAQDVIAAKFGPRVLRTETAGLAAIAVLAARFGDLG